MPTDRPRLTRAVRTLTRGGRGVTRAMRSAGTPHAARTSGTPSRMPPPAVPEARSPWPPADGLLVVGAIALDLFGYYLSSQADGRSLSVPGLLLVGATSLPLFFRRRHPVSVLVAVLVLGLAASAVIQVSHGQTVALVVALYTVARTRGGLVAGVGAVASVGLPVVHRVSAPFPTRLDVIANAVAAVLIVGFAAVVNRWQRDAEARRQLLADRAVAEERRRIARELHDIVSHHITTMKLMAGGARANLTHDPDVARDALVTLEDSGRMALREMRQLLDVLRADDEPDDTPPAPQPGVADVDRIVGESRLGGLPTEFEVRGTPRPLPPTVGLTVFRIVQEALTNARKHAGEATARVRLTYGPDRIDVDVRDDGGGGPTAAGAVGPQRAGHTGYGLVGMRERVALHDGTLTAGPLSGGGFAVTASLPVAPGEAPDTVAAGTAPAVATGEDLHR